MTIEHFTPQAWPLWVVWETRRADDPDQASKRTGYNIRLGIVIGWDHDDDIHNPGPAPVVHTEALRDGDGAFVLRENKNTGERYSLVYNYALFADRAAALQLQTEWMEEWANEPPSPRQ